MKLPSASSNAPVKAIAKLRLRVPGASAGQGRQLALSLAQSLAARASELGPVSGALRVRVPATRTMSPGALADAITRIVIRGENRG